LAEEERVEAAYWPAWAAAVVAADSRLKQLLQLLVLLVRTKRCRLCKAIQSLCTSYPSAGYAALWQVLAWVFSKFDWPLSLRPLAFQARLLLPASPAHGLLGLRLAATFLGR
jgi:hypothetical protein